jgi:hypothetical protein
MLIEKRAVAAAQIAQSEGEGLPCRNADDGMIATHHVVSGGAVNNVAGRVSPEPNFASSIQREFFNLVRLGAGDVAYDDFGKITVVHTVLRPRLMFSLTGKASPPMPETLALKHKLALWFRARHGLRSKAKPARDTMFRAGEVSPAFTKRRWVDI